jgi:hypothetical protein
MAGHEEGIVDAHLIALLSVGGGVAVKRELAQGGGLPVDELEAQFVR